MYSHHSGTIIDPCKLDLPTKVVTSPFIYSMSDHLSELLCHLNYLTFFCNFNKGRCFPSVSSEYLDDDDIEYVGSKRYERKCDEW